MVEEQTFTMIRDIGRDVFLRGLTTSHGGNLSIRTGNSICITCTKSMLGRITRDGIVEVDLNEDDSNCLRASSELIVHRAIYRETEARAILHAHVPYATLLSMLLDEIIPVDTEGSFLLGKVPVLKVEKTIGSHEGAEAVSKALKKYKIVLMRGHGSFARGETLEEAYMLTSSLEASSFYSYHLYLERKYETLLTNRGT